MQVSFVCPQVTALLADYLHKFQIAPVLDEEEVRHWLSFQVCGWQFTCAISCILLLFMRSLQP
jgi:hypothetical protein